MRDIRHTMLWALVGVVIGLMAFSVNYYFITTTFFGYQVLVAPAMFALSFFSEETAFWPKMAIFLSGQYLCYFVVIFIVKKFYQQFNKK